MAYAIETRSLTKDFGGGKGIIDLDMRVQTGAVHGFLGPNGAGKTTAIRLLLDYLRPDRGHARLLGLDVRLHAPELRRSIGYVPGDLALNEGLRGREHLAQSARMHGNVDLDWQAELMQRLGAQPEPRIRELSKGNKQKIALVDALQHRPELLILDEPTDGLDPLLRDEVRKILREHAARGGTVFLSSHVVHEIQTMCDDVAIVINGTLRHHAKVADLIALEGVTVEATVPDARSALSELAELGAGHGRHKGNRIRFRIRGDPLPALARLHAMGGTEPRLKQGDLEEMFLRIYSQE